MFIIFIFLTPKQAQEGENGQFTHSERLENLVFSAYSPQTCVYSDFSREGIVRYITCRAIEAGVNHKLAERIIKCESNFNPQAVGDGGCSRGIWQINTCVHRDISKAEAHDVVKSTDWSMPKLKLTPQIWSCY